MNNLRTLILIGCISLTASVAFGQISDGSAPFSFDHEIRSLSIRTNQTESIALPAVDMEAIRNEDKADESDGVPPRFGFPVEVNITLTNSGIWTVLENGDRIWTMEIYSPDAKSINLLYDKFWLPDNATFHIYNAAKTQYIGGFTERNNKGSKENPGKFGTGLVYGDRIHLEYYEPKAVEGEGIIAVSYVVHGYRYINIMNKFKDTEDFGGSGSCQVNVNCSPEGDAWQDEKTSVALILVGGIRWCTGSLINNVLQDGTPYFLTADHCLGSLDAIGNPDASNWSFYWNYESPGCSDGTDFVPPSTSGATVVANNSASDFALFRLTESPGELSPPVQAYYNGWERNTPLQGGVGIHHPAGDIKKIATHNRTPSSAGNYWELYWMRTTNGFSVTEGGSSGSPLYNTNSRVIGQLYGGSSLNCSDPANDLGRYGKLSVSWNNGTDPRRRLRDWLDPGNTGAMVLNGTYGTCNDNLAVTANVPAGGTDNREANLTITATNVIASAATAVYHAGNEVTMSPGFHAQNGSVFRAYNEGCTGNFATITIADRAKYAAPEVSGRDGADVLSEGSSGRGLVLYPNPAEKTLSVLLSEEGTYTVSIYNDTGHTLITAELDGQKRSIDVSGLVNGTYYIGVLDRATNNVQKGKFAIMR